MNSCPPGRQVVLQRLGDDDEQPTARKASRAAACVLHRIGNGYDQPTSDPQWLGDDVM